VALDETLRIIREEEPPKPSTRLSTSDSLPTVAANRGVEPARLRRAVQGELDWIVMKALEKDRNRRYETASGLARDIERYLRDEPVQARTPSISYRLSKFIRRNRRRVVMGAVLGLALLLTAGSVAWSLRSSSLRQYRSEAELGAALNEAVVLCDQGDWPKAKARVEQAERLLSAHVGAAKHEQLRVMHSDLDMLARLEVLQLQGSPFFSRPERLLDEVDSDAEYAKAFRQYGIDVLQLDPKTAAERLRRSAIQLHLVAGLDDWLWIAKSDSGRVHHLRLVANLADPNELSRRIRNAVGQEDQAALLEIASNSQKQALPISTVLLLYHSMDKSTQERSKAATQILRAAHERSPGNYTVSVLLARGVYGDRPDESIGFMRVAIAARPQNPRLWYFLGIMLRSAKQFDQAAIAMRHSISLDPTRYVAHRELGVSLAAEGHWAEAIDAYSEALRVVDSVDPAANSLPNKNLVKADCLVQCGDGYSHLDQWQNAIGAYSKAIKTDGSHGRAWFGRSRSWMMSGEWRRAAQDAAQVVQLTPNDFDMRFVQAACLLFCDDDEAYRQVCAEALKKSAASKDKYSSYITARACVLAPVGVAFSPELLRRVEDIAGTPGSGGWLHVRAKEHCRLQQYQEALARLDEAMKVDSVWDDRTCLNTLLYSLVHLRLGHEAEGRKYLEQFRMRLSLGEKEKGRALTFPNHIANWLSCQILLREVEALLKQEPAVAEDKSKRQE
jgi:tetratricopeptide (TPR) repeat protein